MKASWNVLKQQLMDKISMLIDQQNNIEMIDQAVQTMEFEFTCSKWVKRHSTASFNTFEGDYN